MQAAIAALQARSNHAVYNTIETTGYHGNRMVTITMLTVNSMVPFTAQKTRGNAKHMHSIP